MICDDVYFWMMWLYILTQNSVVVTFISFEAAKSFLIFAFHMYLMNHWISMYHSLYIVSSVTYDYDIRFMLA